ncbi:hypothetical protein BDN71DRAFT_1436994 [Pleurotus eryngii]|uniref:Uncharacterized protein n=1 Tax=Pleurotus eryngii TaxID=5323 RepID=A0A9P5ZFT2_PLEER|nr:hypothetical protein BDN71DRAFT_1436994 [Pleurotus eryngii]
MSLYRGTGQRPHPLYWFFTLPQDWKLTANGPDSDIPPQNPPNPADTESIGDLALDPKPLSGKPALTAEKKDASVWKGLCTLKAITWDYLAEANTFIAVQALDVRHVLGKGHQLAYTSPMDNLFSNDADPFDPLKANQTRDSLLAIIHAWPSNLSLMPVSCLKVSDTLVFKEAQKEWSALINVNNEGFEITATPHDSQSLPANINLFNWSYAVHQAIASFLHCLNMLLPSSCMPGDLNCHHLTNIYSPDAFFKQHDNAIWLNPLCKDFQQQLTAHFGLASNGIINTDTIIKWFDHDQSVHTALAVVIGMCCGIIPPQHEYQILWDSTDKELQGVFLTPDKTINVVNPSA